MRSIASRMSVMSGEGALAVFARAKELESQGRSIIHLELGEPDFHPGASVIESAAEALAEGKDRYCPVIGVPALRDEIAAYLKRTRDIHVSPANIVIAPGCKAALFFAMMSLLETGDEVLYPDPGFPGYPSITLGLGAVPVPFELSSRNHFQPDLSEIQKKITRRTRMLITNSPGKDAYPIASFTWLLIPTNPADANKGRILKDFLSWMLDKGQGMVEALSYAPLPADVVQKEKAAIASQVKP